MTRVEVAGFRPFVGQHCETVATGSLLGAAGITLSEPMLFGLGEGLGFIFINLRTLPLPFVGGRTRPFAITDALCANLGVECHSIETSSKPKAWAALETPLREGRPVGLQLDCFYLEYFSQPVHFAGHFVAAYGFDEREVLLVDTAPQGSTQRASRAARGEGAFRERPDGRAGACLDSESRPEKAGPAGGGAQGHPRQCRGIPRAGVQGRFVSRHPQARRIAAEMADAREATAGGPRACRRC